MTKIFEITHRDGAARIGKLVLDREISTPAIIQIHKKESPVIDSGSLWKKTEFNELAESQKIVILPHKSLPLHTRNELIEEIQEVIKSPSNSAYTGTVIHPFAHSYPASDLYVLGAAKQLENQPRDFVESIIRLRENTRSDSLLYAPALATPENLSMLIYIGVDIVDETLPIIKGYQDVYLTNSGEYHLDRLHELPCACTVCSGNTPQEMIKLPKKERAESLAQHNSLKLGEEVRVIREQIRTGSLRDT